VRGIAHLGVLSVLRREGIPIDCVAGSSVGSFLGAAYCAGADIQFLEDVAERIGWRALASLTCSTQGFVSFAKLERLLIALLGDLDFADLAVPLAVVTTDLESGDPIVLDRGRLAPAVRASCSVPGIVRPISIDGRVLVDGGVSDNLPVAPLRAMGADYVIGVDICRPAHRRHWGPIGIATRSLEILVRRAGGGFISADCLISPDLAGFSYVRFSRREELIARGIAAAEEKLPAIQAALAVDN
jgi:NTE family protein